MSPQEKILLKSLVSRFTALNADIRLLAKRRNRHNGTYLRRASDMCDIITAALKALLRQLD
jgi:hypothetical protein